MASPNVPGSNLGPATPLEALRHGDAAIRAEALRKIRFRDLKDRETLRAVLEACGDPSPADGPAVVKDPFAAFFRESAAAGATVAEIAAERIEKAGLPEDDATADLLADVLATVGGPLPATAAKLLGDVRWENPDHAVRVLVPALDRHDTPLFEVLVKLPSSVRDTLCALAASPFRPRLFQELLNHPPTQDAAVAAIVRAVQADGGEALDEARSIGLVSTLTAWNRPEAAVVARVLVSRFPALLAWLALDDAGARAELAARIDALGDLGRFWPRIAEVLRQRDPIPDWPVAAFLARTGVDPGVVAAWGVDDATAAVLHGWVAALATDPDRAWTAALALAEAGRIAPSRAALEAAIASADPESWPPFEEAVLDGLAAAGLAGVDALLVRGVALDPTAVSATIAAARRLGAERAVAEAVIARAEGAPRVVERLSAKVVKEHPSGVDIDAVEPLVAAVADPDLAARFDRVRSVVQAG